MNIHRELIHVRFEKTKKREGLKIGDWLGNQMWVFLFRPRPYVKSIFQSEFPRAVAKHCAVWLEQISLSALGKIPPHSAFWE